ncbi:MAG TPA: hypothetical protein VGK78_11200 [Nocardioides sp.]|uniref:hypothetical protein n=1 Tax=Nocardioides sp. TaxID=35761 RepID=UPI002F3F6A20
MGLEELSGHVHRAGREADRRQEEGPRDRRLGDHEQREEKAGDLLETLRASVDAAKNHRAGNTQNVTDLESRKAEKKPDGGKSGAKKSPAKKGTAKKSTAKKAGSRRKAS